MKKLQSQKMCHSTVHSCEMQTSKLGASTFCATKNNTYNNARAANAYNIFQRLFQKNTHSTSKIKI